MEDVLLLGCTESFSEISELAAGSSPQQQQQQQQQGFDNIVLVDSRSYEDPVLVKDQRILANILDRQNDLSVAASKSSSYFDTVQTELKPHMRKIVSDWMLEVCEEQQCQPEVFSLAINYLDRFLSKVNLRKSQFQLLGCVCMFLASKFKETSPLPAENLVIYTDNSVTTYEIMQWEMLVLQVLEWDLSAVTPYSIMDHLLRTLNLDASFNIDTVRKHAETFVALTATEHIFCHSSPAVVAVACLGAALRGLSGKGMEEVLSKLQLLTGVQKEAISSCMDQIEVSINLSMSGESFQPSEPSTEGIGSSTAVATSNNPVVAPPTQSMPKVIPQQPSSGYYQSTTPTDLMEVAQTCVY